MTAAIMLASVIIMLVTIMVAAVITTAVRRGPVIGIVIRDTVIGIVHAVIGA